MSKTVRVIVVNTDDAVSADLRAVLLSISPRTVETYRVRLFDKLGIRDMPSLVRFAIRHGITALE